MIDGDPGARGDDDVFLGELGGDTECLPDVLVLGGVRLGSLPGDSSVRPSLVLRREAWRLALEELCRERRCGEGEERCTDSIDARECAVCLRFRRWAGETLEDLDPDSAILDREIEWLRFRVL